MDNHEQCRAAASSERDERAVQPHVDRELHLRATQTLAYGPGMIGGQGQMIGQSVQCPGPVGDLLCGQRFGVVLAAEQFPLPQGVIGVLHGGWRPAGRAVSHTRVVCQHQVTDERCERGSIRGNVMQHRRQYELRATGDPEQPHPHRDIDGHVECDRSECSNPFRQFWFGNVDRIQRRDRLRDRQDQLDRRTVGLRVPGPQRLVSTDQIRDRGL